jgi:hypothetical protein
MTVDVNALWMFLVSTAIVGAVGLLMGRLNMIEKTLENHGRKLVRIETKLNVPDDIT